MEQVNKPGVSDFRQSVEKLPDYHFTDNNFLWIMFVLVRKLSGCKERKSQGKFAGAFSMA